MYACINCASYIGINDLCSMGLFLVLWLIVFIWLYFWTSGSTGQKGQKGEQGLQGTKGSKGERGSSPGNYTFIAPFFFFLAIFNMCVCVLFVFNIIIIVSN